MRAPSVVVGSLLFVVGVVVGCGGGGSGDADDAPNDGGSGEGAGTETSNGGSTSTAPSCVEDGATASSQAACCSGEIDSGYCCSGETCCGPQNHSQRASNGACQCEPGYEWASPVETNLVCEENQCHPDGFNADSVFDCCSQKIDDFGQCCSAKGCCNASNHSHGSGSQCACDEGYMWASDDPADYSCVVPDDHVIACTSQGYAPQWCECTPQDDNLGEVALTGSCYPDQTFAPMTCCASNSYPEAGSCQCWMTQQWQLPASG